jgi:hypothetical protein
VAFVALVFSDQFFTGLQICIFEQRVLLGVCDARTSQQKPN